MTNMHRFLRNNRLDLIARCQVKVAARSERAASEAQLRFGVPLFLDQLVETLEVEQTETPLDSRKISGPSGGGAALSDIGISAAHHGSQLCELGLTVDQVVHDYGDLCQAITDLAYERDAAFTVDEFRTLNRCLDNAISEAVTEFSFQKELSLLEKHASDERVRHGSLIEQMRNHLNTASLAFAAAKAGNLHLAGATGSVLDRSIESLKNMLQQPLWDAVNPVTTPAAAERLSVADLMIELQDAAKVIALAKGCTLTVTPVEPALAIDVNRALLLKTVGNLLEDAIRFTQPGGEVILNAYALADQVLIDVKGHRGTFSPDATERALPGLQPAEDKIRHDRGSSAARQGLALYGGRLIVRNVPEQEGCVFTVLLPRQLMS